MRGVGVVLLAAVVLRVDHAAIQDALAIANSSIESTHRRFHADYHLAVNRAPVDFVSIVSPFRRLVLSAETAMRVGRRTFGQREALAALQPDPERLEVYVELTFHPHNTFVGMPEYTVALEPLTSTGPAILPSQIDRLARTGPRLDDAWYPLPYPFPIAPGGPSGSEPIRSGTLIARFDGNELDQKGAYAVVIKDGSRELARTRAELGRLR